MSIRGNRNIDINPNFPELDRLKFILKVHGSVLFRPFDKEGLRVSPLKLKVRCQFSDAAISFYSGWNFETQLNVHISHGSET